MPSHPILRLGLEVLAGLGVVAIIAIAKRRVGARADFSVAAAAVLAAAAVAVAVGGLPRAYTDLANARHSHLSAVAGTDYCYEETQANARLGFIAWVKRALPPHAVYVLDYAPQPDAWCITLSLLPRLPAGPGGFPTWIVAYGVIPPDLAARIARHDPTVRVYAPGFALARVTA